MSSSYWVLCPDLVMAYNFIHLSTLFTAWTTSQGKNGKYSFVVLIWRVHILCDGKMFGNYRSRVAKELLGE